LERDTLVSRLAAAGCVAAEEEADELLAAEHDEVTLEDWIRRRERGEPLAWIVGSMQFCGQRLLVDPGVYVPRVQSEELARRAARRLPADGRAADLCTGAGAIAVHLMASAPSAVVVACDISISAVRCAWSNGALVVLCDLDQPLQSGSFDLVTAVAPYVPTSEIRLLPADVQRYEPRLALDGGQDGLALVGRIVAGAARVLRPHGWLLLEVGGGQDESVVPLLEAAGFGEADLWFDEDGDLRGIASQLLG
jgi:release factor glutamine methyltransferase